MNSDFEKHLQQQSMRELPREWRAEILQSARTSAAPTAARAESRSLFSALQHQIYALLWPCPKAWAGLAAVWAVIAVLNLSLAESDVQIARTKTSPVQWMMAHREQEKALSALDGPVTRTPADRPRKSAPSPRSQTGAASVAV